MEPFFVPFSKKNAVLRPNTAWIKPNIVIANRVQSRCCAIFKTKCHNIIVQWYFCQIERSRDLNIVFECAQTDIRTII